MFWAIAPSPDLDSTYRTSGAGGLKAALYPANHVPSTVPTLPSVASQLIPARPGKYAYCASCGQRLMSVCGTLTLWHWRHESLHDCDTWSEAEGEWHVGWKQKVPPERREVVIGPHRADILNSRGLVIELQHSRLSAEDIQAREAHYGDMIWLWDGLDGDDKQKANLRDKLVFKRADDRHTFQWLSPRKSMWAITKPLFIDLRDSSKGVFLVKGIEKRRPCYGWGHFVDKKSFVEHFFC